MSPDWMLTWAAVACAGMIVVHLPAESARPSPWQWDSSHRCRLALIDIAPDAQTTRIRVRNDTVFAVRYRVRVTTGDVEAASLTVEAWPGAVSEIVLPVAPGSADITVPDCRRRT